MISASAQALPGSRSAGLSPTQLPNVRAGAIFHAGMAMGKFHGVVRHTTPMGLRVTSTPMPVLTKSRLDRSRHAALQVFESLREAILSLELVPSTMLMLMHSDLVAQFGVSQPPILEALLRFEDEGLVQVLPQHATLVSRIDVAGNREAHFLRRAIELEIVRALALQPPAGLVEQPLAQCALQASLAAAQRYDDFLSVDHGFHRLMYEAAGVMGRWAAFAAIPAMWTGCGACICLWRARLASPCASTAPSSRRSSRAMHLPRRRACAAPVGHAQSPG